MAATVQAAVKVGVRTTELRDFPLPDVGPDGGLLKVVAAGVCGADVKWYAQPHEEPRILGHENVGTIAAISDSAARQWGVRVGDLVALEEYLPCGHCDWCRLGEFRHCADSDPTVSRDLRFGSTPVSVPPALWGGFSEYLYLPPNAVLHKVPDGVTPHQAAMALPLGNGVQWAYIDGGVRPGSAVLVQGPGQQGLSCALAAIHAGAELVIVSGAGRDRRRLEVAQQFGAVTVDVDAEDLLDRVAQLTGGDGVDVAIDASGGSERTVLTALRALKRKEGTAVLQPAKVTDFPMETLNRKAITLRMTRGHSYRAVEAGLRMLAAHRFPFELMSTHQYGLAEVDAAIRAAGGADDAQSVHVTVLP